MHCPVGSITLNGKCYLLHDARNELIMNEQQELCNTLDMTLLVADSKVEMNEISQTIGSLYSSYNEGTTLSIPFDIWKFSGRPLTYLPNGQALFENDLLDYTSMMTNGTSITKIRATFNEDGYQFEFMDKHGFRGQIVLCQKDISSFCISQNISAQVVNKSGYYLFDCIQECKNMKYKVSIILLNNP